MESLSTPSTVDEPQQVTATTVPTVADRNRTAIYDRVTGLWSDDPRYSEPGGSAGDIRPQPERQK